MSPETALQWAMAAKSGGVYLGLVLSLSVVVFLFNRNHNLHRDLLEARDAAAKALGEEKDAHRATAMQVIDNARRLAAVAEQLARGRKVRNARRPTSAGGAGGPNPSGSADVRGGSPNAPPGTEGTGSR